MTERIEGRPPFIPQEPPELLLTNTRENREQNWQRMSEYFKTITDRVGTPIDEKVFETVVGLNLNGVETSASDEGHAERLYASPWIQFRIPHDNDVAKRVEELDEMTDYLYDTHPESPELTRLMDEYVKRREELEEGRREVFQKITSLLSEFYQGKTINDWSSMLTINAPEGLIEPNGAYAQPVKESEQKRQNLEAFQAEMQAFGAFLHQRYVGNANNTDRE